MATSILDLQVESIYLVADHLATKALLALSRTCHILHILLTPRLNTLLASRAPSIVCRYVRYGVPNLLKRALPFCPDGFFLHDLGLLSDLITWGHYDTVRLLLQHRIVDPKSYRKGEWEKQAEPTPLLMAVYSENIEIIKLLLEAGAVVDLGSPGALGVAKRLQGCKLVSKGEIVHLLEKVRRKGRGTLRDICRPRK